MNILLFNHLMNSYDLDKGAQACHGVAGREIGLATGFGKLGWHAHILTAYEPAQAGPVATTHSGVSLVHIDTMRPEDYDIVLLMESSSWQHLVDWKRDEVYPNAVKLLDHPFVCALVDGLSNMDQLIVERAELVGHVSHRNIPVWRERYGDNPPCFLSQWAVPSDLPVGQSSPYEPGTKNLIFTGCMVPRYVKMLNELAKTFDGNIWIAALFVAFQRLMPQVMAQNEDVISGYGLSDEGRRRLFPSDNIRFISDVRPAGYGHGPVVYGHFWDFLEHADVALGFTLQPGMLNQHIKLWDYQAYGIPVVHEKGSPLDDFTWSSRDISLQLVSWNNPVKFSKGIERALTVPARKKETMEWIKAAYTWDNRAARWIEEIEEIVNGRA